MSKIGVLVTESLIIELLLVPILDLIESLSSLISQMQPLDLVVAAFELFVHGLDLVHEALLLDLQSLHLVFELVSTLVGLP